MAKAKAKKIPRPRSAKAGSPLRPGVVPARVQRRRKRAHGILESATIIQPTARTGPMRGVLKKKIARLM